MHALFGLGKEVSLLVYSLVAGTFLDLSNDFLSRVKTELDNLVKPGDVGSKAAETDSLIRAIMIVLESDEFNRKWGKFSHMVASKLNILIKRVDIVVDRDVKDVLEKLNNLVTENIYNLIQGSGQAAYTAACAIPPLAPFCEGADIFATGSKVGASLFINTIEIVDKMTTAFDTVFGDTALPMADGIKQMIEFKNFFEDAIEKAQNISATGVDMLNTATEGVKDVREGVGKQLQSQTPQPQPQQTGGKKKKRKQLQIKVKRNKRKNKKKQRYSRTNNTRKFPKSILKRKRGKTRKHKRVKFAI
jgi:galactitol-specific phosphotransferase system IIB component